jgi:hypothetical protein
MPGLVRGEGLDEASAFLGRLALPCLDQACGFEHTVSR